MRLQNVEPPTDWGKDLGDPVAVLRVEPEQLTREVGLAFVRGYDDLDYVRVAAVSLGGGRPFLLLRQEADQAARLPLESRATCRPAPLVAATARDGLRGFGPARADRRRGP